MTTANSRNLRFRVRPHLADLQARNKTNREVAAILGCDEAALCRVLKALGLKKDPPIDRKAKTELHKQRQAFRQHAADTMPPIEAAKACNVTLRTIYRYINLKK